MVEKKTPKIPPKDDKPAKPSKDTVFIDVEDEITTIIDKVEGAKEKIVALVLPKRASVLQSTVNMRLLKRAADKAGKSPVLITNDEALLPLAGLAGLHAAKNLQSKPFIPEPPTGKMPGGTSEDLDAITDEHPTKLDYHRSVGELATGEAMDDDDTIDLDEEPDSDDKKTAKKAGALAGAGALAKDKKLKVPDFDRFRLKILLAAGLGVLLIVFLVLALFVLPKATITVKTTSVPAEAEFTLTTSDTAASLDMAQKVIPGSSRTSEQTVSQSIKATGQQNNGEKAEGSVTMSAQRCAPSIGQPADIPAGTGVSTSGLTFTTQKKASFSFDSAAGSCVNYKTSSVDIVAQSAGAKYNVSGASFSVQGYSATASGSASGGTDNIITTLTQADVDKVKQQITSESSDQFSKTFLDQLDKEGFFAIASSLKLSDPVTTATPSVGQPASTAQVTAKVTYSVLVVKKDDLKTAVTDELNKNLDKNKQKLSTDDVLRGINVDIREQKSPAVATLDISQTTTAVPIIDTEAVKKQAAGQKTSTIKAILSGTGGVEQVDVKLSPFWVSKAPSAGKITVVQEEVKASEPEAENETP